jgi:hypothetical protein
MASTNDNACHYFYETGHAREIKWTINAVDNKTGQRITVCDSCVVLNKVRPCGLCGKKCVNKTLKISGEVFCYECIWDKVPEYLCTYFHEKEGYDWGVFGLYYQEMEELDFNFKHIDFSSPDTIGLLHLGTLVTRNTGPNKCLFFYLLGFYARHFMDLREFIKDEMLPALRQQRIDAGCAWQIERRQREEEGVKTIEHFMPLSVGAESAKYLLPKKFIRTQRVSTAYFEKMRDTNDFDSFQKFLREK